MRKMNRTLTAALAVICLGGLGAAPAQSTGSAKAGSSCDDPKSVVISTRRGATVWIPSSRSAGPFQWGGSQSLSTTDGKLKASTKGHTNTVGGSGGVSFPMVEASASYDHQWQKSTTVTNSFTQTFATDSGTVGRATHWRWRLYVRGYKFIATKTLRYVVPCKVIERSVKKVFVLPSSRRVFSFGLETYAKRGWILNGKGTPIRG